MARRYARSFIAQIMPASFVICAIMAMTLMLFSTSDGADDEANKRAAMRYSLSRWLAPIIKAVSYFGRPMLCFNLDG